MKIKGVAFAVIIAILSCSAPKHISTDNKLIGRWLVDSIYYMHGVNEKILERYNKEMKEIRSNSFMEFRKDNTFSFVFGFEMMEGVWYSTLDEKVLVTQGFREREPDSFSLEFKSDSILILSSITKVKDLLIFLKK